MSRNEGNNTKCNCNKSNDRRAKCLCTSHTFLTIPQADFKSGYGHGIADASDRCNNNANITCHGPAYVWEPDNGFINQTDDFIDGYVIRIFRKIAGPNSSMD